MIQSLTYSVHYPAQHISAQHIKKSTQQGVGLIEVMVALFILAFGALAIASMQATALTGVRTSSSHFAVTAISEEILEHLKADRIEAGRGSYNTTFDESVAPDTASIEHSTIINGWKAKTADSLRSGAAAIDCTAIECTVSLRWRETVTIGINQQLYQLKVPLQAY